MIFMFLNAMPIFISFIYSEINKILIPERLRVKLYTGRRQKLLRLWPGTRPGRLMERQKEWMK